MIIQNQFFWIDNIIVMLQKKYVLFLTSICILLVVWLITAIHCHPSDLREGWATKEEKNASMYACFDDRTGNMLQSCKDSINDFATNLGKINKIHIETVYNSIVSEDGCFDKNSGEMIQPCRDAIYNYASNFTQMTKSDIENGVSEACPTI
jgi:hypothetical protein